MAQELCIWKRFVARENIRRYCFISNRQLNNKRKLLIQLYGAVFRETLHEENEKMFYRFSQAHKLGMFDTKQNKVVCKNTQKEMSFALSSFSNTID